MERWSAWREVPLTITAAGEGFEIGLPDGMQLLGKTKVRVRLTMWPSYPHCQHTPAVDAVRAVCYPSSTQIQLTAGTGRFTDSTISTHTGYGAENSAGGRAEVVRDRTVLGGYSYPIEWAEAVQYQGIYYDTAVGFKIGVFGDTYDEVDWADGFVFEFDSGVPISWSGGGIWDLAVGWIIATPNPNGGVSFVRMMEPQWGPNRNMEWWYCDAPRAVFGIDGEGWLDEEGTPGVDYIPGHRPTAFIYEGSSDEPPQPYGHVYMCEGCRKWAAEHGYENVGFGGESTQNRFIKLKTNANGGIYSTQYSRPAAISGHAQEFYFNYHPVHNTRATLSWNGYIKDGNLLVVDDSFSREWGRDNEMRGLHNGQLNGDAPNTQVFFDPWFSDGRPTPTLGEADFLQPPQYQQSKDRLSVAYPVGDYDFPSETVWKWKTQVDPWDPFDEPQPIDEPLNMRCFDLSYDNQYPCVYTLNVSGDHFYIGSNSRTVSTDSAFTKQPHNDQFRMFFQWTMMGAATGTLIGTMGGLAVGATYLAQPWQFPDETEKTGGGGDEDHPTRYLRRGWDFTPWSQALVAPHNSGYRDHNTRLPNGDLMPWKEAHLNHVFGAVPCINAFVDYDGHVIVTWNHSKRWQGNNSIIMQKMGQETQLRRILGSSNHSFAANPNRLLCVSYGMSPSAFFDTSTGTAWCIWSEWTPVGYFTYIKQFNIHEALSPQGTLYNAAGKYAFFDGAGAMTDKQETHITPTEIPDIFIPNVSKDNYQTVHLQHARHAQVKFHPSLPVAYLTYDREILYTHQNGALVPARGNEEYNFTVSQVYLERALIDPWEKIIGITDSGDIVPLLSKQGAMQITDVPIACGRNPSISFAKDGFFVFYNRDDNQLHDKVFHGGGYVDYTANIPPSNDIKLKIDGAPIEADPLGQRPYIAAYVSTWPVQEDVYFRSADISSMEKKTNEFIANKIGQGTKLDGTLEWSSYLQEHRQEIMDYISSEALGEETRVVMRDCSLPSPQLLNEIISSLRSKVAELSFRPSFSTNPSNLTVEQMEQAYIEVYKQYPQVSHTMLYALFGGIIQGWDDKQLKYVAWTRAYLENDSDIRCPECGEYDIWWEECGWGKLEGQDETYPEREIATFNCNGCGKQWVEQCHGFTGANVDAVYEENRNRLWLVGGRWRENLSLGAVDGELLFTWSVNDGSIWKAERWLPTDQVNYQHIVDKDPGPDSEDKKPYLWDSSDTFEHTVERESYFNIKEETSEPDYNKIPIPVEDGLKHIAVLPEHKISAFLSQSGDMCVAYLQLELYDAALAARETDNPKGDHVATTCSPTIPRIAKTKDGGLTWSSDYYDEDEDVMIQPKRDWWELPLDLKDKTKQG
jgi:hypothetical protein